MKKFTGKPTRKTEKGQVLVILALTILGLVAIVGLAVDMGYMYVSYARLRRAVDAAALAGSGEFKRNYDINRLRGAAMQMLNLNGVQRDDDGVDDGDPGDLTFTNISVLTCDVAVSVEDIAKLCKTPPKKIVLVRVTEKVPTFFLAVIGWHEIPITIESLSEAATVDVVLALDTSESMTVGWPYAPKYGDDRDPKACNEDDPTGGADGYPGSCFPFQDVKIAADLFLNNLYFPYDRVAVVHFDKYAEMDLPLTDTYATIHNAVINMTVFQGYQPCPYTVEDRAAFHRWEVAAMDDSTPAGTVNPCRWHHDATWSPPNEYIALDCPEFYGMTPDVSQCLSTNIGDGITLSGAILAGDYSSTTLPSGSWPVKRDDALWVLILLTDGAANSGHDITNNVLCPGRTNAYRSDPDWSGDVWDHPNCRDEDVLERHCWVITDTDCMGATGTTNTVDQDNYDPDDLARDRFDLVAGNNTLIFTIGMGDAQSNNNPYTDINGTAPGEALLEYGATVGSGLYKFGASAAQLNQIFLAIANNIATRINP